MFVSVLGLAESLALAASGDLLQTFLNPTPVTRDFFGVSVVLGEDIAMVGADLASNGARDTGAIYVFAHGADEQWSQTAKLAPADGGWADRFGRRRYRRYRYR